MALGLSHSLSRYKLKFSPDKVDTMIVQAINLLDDLDKEINTYAMRVREWYGWHFPEMGKIVADNQQYAKVALKAGVRSAMQAMDFSGILAEDVEAPTGTRTQVISLEEFEQLVARVNAAQFANYKSFEEEPELARGEIQRMVQAHFLRKFSS